MTGCGPSRLLRLENKVLEHELTALQTQVDGLQKHTPASADFVTEPTLEDVHRFLTAAGYKPQYEEGSGHIHLEFEGLHTEFSVNIQHFADADVLFLATGDYLSLSDAEDTDALMLMLVQIAALNYQLLLGKFQLNPESGDVLLSTEIILEDGLGSKTFLRAFEQLLQTADQRYPDLKRAAAGGGI